jgi:predicted nucleotidyltransferase
MIFSVMRTLAPSIIPLFRSEMQLRLLALLLLQPERSWTLQELAGSLAAPASSVHRELGRAEDAGIVNREANARPHRFAAATNDAFYEPLVLLLSRSVGVETELRVALDEHPGVLAAVIHGSWAGGSRRPDSDIDVLVVGHVDLRDLRRRLRPIGERAGRTFDLTVLSRDEFQRIARDRSSFARSIFEAPTTPLVGDLASIAAP